MIDGDLVLAVERIKDGVAYTYGYGLLLKVETDTYVGPAIKIGNKMLKLENGRSAMTFDEINGFEIELLDLN